MTKQEFNEYLQNYLKNASKTVDDLTDEDLYIIGRQYKELATADKSWEELVKQLHVNKTGEQFRVWIKGRQYQDGSIKKNVQLLSGQTIDDLSFPEAEEKLNQIKNDLYVQQTKTRDQRNSLRRSLRDEARIQDMKDLIKDTVSSLPPLKALSGSKPVMKDDASDEKEAVLLFSDLHIGAIVNLFYNKYNYEIAERRVDKIAQDVIRTCYANNVSRLNFCSMGDLIHGALRVSSRVENNENKVKEVIRASEIMANLLTILADNIPEVVYRSTLGNHDRMNANYNEAIEKENFCYLIDWYLEARLKDTRIVFEHEQLDDTIGLFQLKNSKNFAFVHGDRDKDVRNSLLGLSSYLNCKIHYFALGHLHSIGLSTIQGSTVFRNGSIMGVDDYANSIRAYGPAAQTLLIFDNSNNVINVTIDLSDIQ